MKKPLFKFIKYTFLLCVIVLLCAMFYPRTYDVPQFKTRAGTQYWELSIGSKIGYTMVPGKGIKKPYPIIFLQGGPGGPIFDKNIQILSQLSDDGYDIYLYDQLGCGHSSRLKDISGYTVERHKTDLAEIIQSIQAKKVILMGQSWGAMLATQFVTDHQNQVEKIIFTGPGPILPIRHELANLKAPDSLNLKTPFFTNRQGNEKASNIRTKTVDFFAERFSWKLASEKEMDDYGTYLFHELGRSTVYDTSKVSPLKSGYGYYVHLKTVQSFEEVIDKRDQLRNCPIPVLILRGQYDGIKWGFVSEYLELFPNHQLIIIPKAGHSIATEQPLPYIKMIKDFLNKP